MDFRQFFEATREYVEKTVDPALLTFSEYYRLANPSGKSHPENAYNISLEDGRSFDKSEFPEKIKTVKIQGIEFEFRLKKEDKMNKNFVKTTPDGEIVRDENGKAVFMSDEEKLKMLKTKGGRYEYSVGVFTKEDGWVGGSQNEWGAMLIRVVEEYRGFGLGTMIGKLARSYEPAKSSGGFTPAGFNMFKKVHAEFVRDYMQSGMYSHLVKTGQITPERAKEIISSIGERPKKREEKKLDTSDPNDWLLYAEDDNFIIYDKKIKDIIDEEFSYWKFKMIKGSIFARESDGYYRILYFGGETEEVKKHLMTLCAIRAKWYDALLVVEPEDVKYVDESKIELVEENTVKPGYRSSLFSYKGKAFDTDILGREEERFRKKFDKYDEFHYQILELAYGKYKK